jgi:predicted phage terminase large subunit-like protein
MTIDKDVINAIACELARKNFYAYCRIMLPQVYKPHRLYLKQLCDTLQAFHEDRLLNKKGQPLKGLAIRSIPRAGKTTTANLFATWVISKNHGASVISASYNETLATRASKTVRGYISAKSADGSIVNSTIFRGTQIKDGDASMQMWSLADSGLPNWLATSPSGTVTGLGVRAGGYLIFDDIIKNASEALNPKIHNDNWEWYWGTMASRVENGGKQLFVATPWSIDDLQNRLIQDDDIWGEISFKATKTWPDNPKSDADMLDYTVLPCDEYLLRKSNTDPLIFSANYDLSPMNADPSLLMYPKLSTYRQGVEDTGATEVFAMIDPAGKGTDYFTCVVYTVKDGFAYVKDILYDNSHGSVTEPLCAKMLTFHNVSIAHIEENGLGEGAKRAIEKILRADGNTTTTLKGYSQGANKLAKIIEHATAVCNTILFPEGWHLRWPKAYRDLTTCTRVGKLEHDDLQDTLANIVIKSLSNPDFFFI